MSWFRLSRSPSFGQALAAPAIAVLCAGSLFILPAWDDVLPGGAFSWQVAAIAMACGTALWGLRRMPRDASARLGWVVRMVAMAALLLALLWIAGVGLLWLIWPR